jgi:hypothetical protein
MINLVKRLREHYDDDGHLQKEAADRITALEAERDAAFKHAQMANAEYEKVVDENLSLEGALRKAQVALTKLADVADRYGDIGSEPMLFGSAINNARAAHAEIEKVLK